MLAWISHTKLAHRGAESAKVVLRERLHDDSRSAPMPTECSADLFGFAPVEGREVVAAFDGGAITSDAGALLLGAADRAIKLTERLAACFHDVRRQDLIEHEVVTLVGQRVFGIALGYEDLNDHGELRHDPVMAVLAGKLARSAFLRPRHGGKLIHPAERRAPPNLPLRGERRALGDRADAQRVALRLLHRAGVDRGAAIPAEGVA